MTDIKHALRGKFQDSVRYANFGETISEIHVKGVRCHSNTSIRITSPVTAFCGLNGTGKTTLLQLAAVAFQKADDKPGYIKDYMPMSVLDTTPFKENASVVFKYNTNGDSAKTRSLTFHVTTQRKRWRGYDKRSKKPVFFGNVGLYLVKAEYGDFVFRHAGNLEVSDSQAVDDRVKFWSAKILGQHYDSMEKNLVTFSDNDKTGEVHSVSRGGIQYSEHHMGYGEARLQYLIDSMEVMPEKSLILLEEPEISLHPSAQHEFGNYLLDLANTKKHQIIITTHSEFILETLPPESRIYLDKSTEGIRPIPGLTSLQAKSLMTEAYIKALTILVEDNLASAILSELLRQFDYDLHRTVGIIVGGSDTSIKPIISTLRETSINIIGVLDGDKNPHATSPPNIFYLPGSHPPEKELFGNILVKDYLRNRYRVDYDTFYASKLQGVDHHNWLGLLAKYVNQKEDVVMYELAREYAASFRLEEIAPLIQQLRTA